MKMVNFELGNEMWKMNYSTWHEPGTKKISESPDRAGIERMTSQTHGGCSIHWATRTHGEQGHLTEWQGSCILLGSALSNSSWVVVSEWRWWMLSSVMKSERWIIQHGTSVGQRNFLSIWSPKSVFVVVVRKRYYRSQGFSLEGGSFKGKALGTRLVSVNLLAGVWPKSCVTLTSSLRVRAHEGYRYKAVL